MARVNKPEQKNNPKFETATKPVPDPNVFVPTSIPELHPEYSHSEPYCFAAKTESTRVLVQKLRGAQGQPATDRADILKEQGMVVVRGPSYAAQKAAHQSKVLTAPAPPAAPVAPVTLQVEMPSTADENYVDSDDRESTDDENVDTANVHPARRSSAMSRKSGTSLSSKKGKSRSRRETSSKGFRIKSRSSRKSKTKSRSEEEQVLQTRNCDMTSEEGEIDPDFDAEHSADSTPPASGDPESIMAENLKKYMDNTPEELLAPIMVPRLSGVFEDGKPSMSPALSNDSWGPTDSSQRYEDVEGDNSSGFVSMSAVGKEKIVHKASYPPRAPDLPLLMDGAESFLDAPSHSTISHSIRSKRKSKPFLPSAANADTSTLHFDHPEKSLVESSDPLVDRPTNNELGAVPEPNVLSRQISLGVMSDDIQVVDTSADTSVEPSTEETDGISPATFSASRAAKIAALERIGFGAPRELPEAPAPVQNSIMRRASASKRKTVSFHTAAPTIIEPNLRAPSQSVPRNVVLSKEPTATSQRPASALRNTRDSVMVARSTKPTPPLQDREPSDMSTGSGDSFRARSSKRMSSRVSIKDKEALREATKRQSTAVAKAMSDQIRGIPKSAMLAFDENEVVLDDAFDDDDSSRTSLKRVSRHIKSRAPVIQPGVVPPPPPPPPFTPDVPRVRSVRLPPPPPVSPLPH